MEDFFTKLLALAGALKSEHSNIIEVRSGIHVLIYK